MVANAACESCHLEEAREWRASRHRSANTNPAYRRAFAVEPSSFCQGCHAPESEGAAPPPVEVSAMGVGCVTCHVVEEGTVIAAAKERPEGLHRPTSAPHGVLVSRDFGGPGACASCHEFSFPARAGEGPGELMQTTLREHAASASSGRACASCHMPRRRSHRSHAFAETRDPAWLRSALEVRAAIGSVGSVVLTLRQTRPGHAFPTGDLFRRLEVGAELVDGSGRALRRDVRHLARHFEVRVGGRGRELVGDDRLRDEPVEVDLDVTCPGEGDPGARVRWWVTYQRVAEAFRGDRPEEALVESEVLLHEGTLCGGT